MRAPKYVRWDQYICNFYLLESGLSFARSHLCGWFEATKLPGVRAKGYVEGSTHEPLCYWEGALQLLCNKLCLKVLDHGSISTWGPRPSTSRLRAQKYDPPPLKQTFPTTSVL
jgi:hypothetical protein